LQIVRIYVFILVLVFIVVIADRGVRLATGIIPTCKVTIIVQVTRKGGTEGRRCGEANNLGARTL
jgi:hypothetical protein